MGGEVQSGHRLAGVEGLRGLAAGGVLLGHVYLYASPEGNRYDLGSLGLLPRASGTVGVVLFFTLSGFLLYRPFAAALLAGTPAPSVRAYLRNRFLRIFPAYWFALLGTGLVLRTAYLPALEVEGRSLASEPGVLAANLLLVQGYAPGTLLTGIGPAWSLAVELVFYLVLPVLAAGAALLATRTAVGRSRPWAAALAPVAVLLVVGQLGSRLAYAVPGVDGGSWAGSWHAVLARSFLAHAAVFAAGVLLAVVHVQVTRGVLRLPVWWRGCAWVGTVLVAAPAVVAFDASRITEHRATLALSLACALLLALVVLPSRRQGAVVRMLGSRPLQWSGLVSYGVFLWHEPLVWFLARQGWTLPGRAGFVLALLCTIVAAGAAALLSWRLVERPCLALKAPAVAPAPVQPDTASPVVITVQRTGADPLVLPTQTSARRSPTDNPVSDGTTSRRGAGAKPTPATLGTATTAQPAASPAATPDGESSITTHRDGSAPSR
jgi:peptidoglycan/LPS O-acetylase OafA/YrhL